MEYLYNYCLWIKVSVNIYLSNIDNIKIYTLPQGGNDIAQYFTLFAGKPKHNSGNDILGGNQDMLKDRGTYWTSKFNTDDCMSSILLFDIVNIVKLL